jgi:O-antigen chain-terminating methyltransferase
MEEFYGEPDEPLKLRRFIEYKTTFIDPLFPEDKSARIADLGAGYGLFLEACQRLGYTNIEGVEIVPKFRDYAKREFGIESIFVNDLFHYLDSKDDNYFDVVTAFNIVEHIKKEKIQYLLSLINRKIRPGGMFIMEVPNADSPLGIHTFFTDITHEFAFSRKLAQKLLRLAGFDNIRVMYQPMRRNPLIKLGQKIVAKLFGSEYPLMFSGNIILVGYK